MQKRPSNREVMAALVAQVIESRYPNQPFEECNKQDWLRAAMECDPIVLLEAAWEWHREGERASFRPMVAELLRVAGNWTSGSIPYLPLSRALVHESPSDGLAVLISRFGVSRWETLKTQLPRPSDERRWRKVNGDHRQYVLAHRRMLERGSLPWLPAEAGRLAVSSGLVLTLSEPNTHHETQTMAFLDKLTTIKRLA